MKISTPLSIMTTFIICLLSYNGNTQNYNFTLIQNSNYNFTVAAVSQFDSGSFQPITQSYGFVLVVPDGVTITIDQVMPSGTNETITAIPGANVTPLDSSMSDKDLFLITADTAGATFNAHSNFVVIPLVTLTVNGSPTSGEIRILSNSSDLASHPAINGSLDAFLQVDITDDSIVNFSNEFDTLTGIEAYSFDTLSVETVTEDLNISLYPNPARNEIKIITNDIVIDQVEIYNVNGQRIMLIENQFEKVDISQLRSALYFVKLRSMEGNYKTIKLLKQ
ncbi:T9SS type A sorting domain-containing protein [Psychroserpens luteolus]|uniref:T9SS type A sorting domain-containing protein n=1 Tax=Psychroserpens luteolus TaxID=2855840 RepID=UPI001E425CCA|nr:T9SS type A sorting domain-containing protein [Psychroserpens luteolus]MCD2260127.1 T9SS type A sorting domain-containing protein [Psychroserpens luteolus]